MVWNIHPLANDPFSSRRSISNMREANYPAASAQAEEGFIELRFQTPSMEPNVITVACVANLLTISRRQRMLDEIYRVVRLSNPTVWCLTFMGTI